MSAAKLHLVAALAAPPPGTQPQGRPLQVCVGHASSTGRRETNEDFFGAVTPEGTVLSTKGALLAVADGVSGAGGGREAAEYTVRSLLGDYYATPDTWEVPLALDRVLTERLRDRVGDVHVTVECVDQIPRSANGKFRAVICKLPHGAVDPARSDRHFAAP